jgi:hypothetical protein
MPEIDASFVPYVTRKIGDAEVKFARFTPRDRATILSDLRKQRKADLVENAKIAGLDTPALFNELAAFDDRPAYGSEEFVAYVNTEAGRLDVVERALVKQGATKEAAQAMPLADDDVFSLVLEICNLTRTPTPTGDGSANPPTTEGAAQPPQGYGT